MGGVVFTAGGGDSLGLGAESKLDVSRVDYAGTVSLGQRHGQLAIVVRHDWIGSRESARERRVGESGREIQADEREWATRCELVRLIYRGDGERGDRA